jgi:chromosome segregation ATPase
MKKTGGSGSMASEELRIVLEDVKAKFDLVIEAVHMTNERLDRHEKAEEERFGRLETEVLEMKGDIVEMKGDIVEMKGDIVEMKRDIVVMKGDIVEMKGDIVVMKGDIVQMKNDIRDLRQDFNDHRLNTELHTGKKGKKVS